MAKERESNNEREDKLDSASKKLDSTVEEFRDFVTEFGKINKDVADKFKKTLSSTEKAQLDVFAAASNIQRQYNSIFDGMEEAGDTFSASGAFLVDNIVNTTDKAFKANRAEAKQLRKDIESMRASSVHLHGEERAKVEAMIDTAVDQLKAVSGGVSVFKEAVRKRFDPANMVEKLFGGGMIGGMFGDMIRISRERKKTAAMTEMQTQTLGGPVSAGQQAIIKELQNVRESIVSTADPKQNELFAEEKEREAGRKSIGAAGMVASDIDIDVDSGGRFADMLSAMMWSSWLPKIGMFLKTNLLAPLWVGFSHFVLLPLKTLFLKFLIAPLARWGSAFIAKLAASKMWGAISGVGKRAAGSGIGQAIIGKRFAGGQFMPGGASGIHGGRAVAGGQRSGLAGFIGRGIQKIKGAPAAAKAARSPASMVGAATKSAGKATSAAGAATSKTPKKGVLKSLADGIKSFGRKGIMRGVLNLGLLAIALIPFAFAMKLFSSGVTMGGILAFAASITVMVVAVKALSKMGSEVVKGALALSILGVALVPLAFGLALMKDVGIGTIFVLAGALLVLGVAASIFGGMAANPFFWLGILAIAALGVALLPLAFAMKIAAEAFQIFTNAIDIEKMMMIGPMLMFAAPGLLAFGAAALFASPGLILLAFASMLLTASKASEILPPLLESFAEFSERVNPSNLFRGALGIVALGGALLAFTAAGVAAQALATLGGVASNFMTLGGLLGAAAPGPFDMLKMFIAFGEHGDGIGRGADGIEKLRNSMASFATMDTEGIKEGVTSVIDAIDEFSRAAFRAAFYGGIGNFLLGADPLDSFIMLAKVGPGIGAGADGIKRLGQAFVEFSKLGESGAMSFFQEGTISESGFENLMEALSGSLSEIDSDEFETKIALLERLANAMNALAGGKPIQPIQAGQMQASPNEQFSGGRANAATQRKSTLGPTNRGGGNSQVTDLGDGKIEVKSFRPIKENRDKGMQLHADRMQKEFAGADAQKALAMELGILEGDPSGKSTAKMPPGSVPKVTIEEIDGQRVAVATLTFNPVESEQLGIMAAEMNAMGGSRGSAAGLGVGGPQDLARRARAADVGSNPASMQSANNSLNAGAVGASNRTNAAGAQQSGPIVVNTANNVNQAADTFFTQNPSTRNNESSLQKATRRMYDDSDI
jgi:hypothetical protein